MSNAKAIIFDLEGVIIDSEPLWTKADLAFLKHHGIIVDFEEYEELIKPVLMGRAIPEGVKIYQKRYKLKGTHKQLVAQRKTFVRNLFMELPFIDGFFQFHNQIKNKHITAIATSLERSFLGPADLKLGLSKLFNGNIFSIEDIGFISKPDPAIFLYAAKSISVNPQNCIVIEDSPNGILAAKAAGMRCIVLTTTTPRGKLNSADLIVDSYQEIDLNKF